MDRSLAKRISTFYFLLFMPIGMQAPYMFLFFKRRGYTDSELGTLAAVGPLLSILAPPAFGAVADMLGDRRRALAGLLLLSGLVFPWLIHAGSFTQTLALLIVFSAFSSPPGAIADAITLEHLERKGGDYGRLRLWGSLGFAVPLLALGGILKKSAGETAASLYPVFLGYTLFRILSAGWVGLLPPSRGARRGLLDLRAIHAFSRWRFLALAICALVASGAMSGYYLYFMIYLDDVGIPDNLKGYYWVIAVAAETGMMLFVGRLIRAIGLKWTFVLSVLGCALRLFVFSFTLSPIEIAAAQLLHALTFTTFTVSTITFVSRFTPPELRASGQTVWMALTGGLGATAGAKLAGVAAGAFGLPGMFRVFSLAAVVALVGAMVLVREPEAKGEE